MYPSLIAIFINPRSNLVPSTNRRWVDSSTIISPLLCRLTIIILIGSALLIIGYTPWFLHMMNMHTLLSSTLWYGHASGYSFQSFFAPRRYNLKGLLFQNRNNTYAFVRLRILPVMFLTSFIYPCACPLYSIKHTTA